MKYLAFKCSSLKILCLNKIVLVLHIENIIVYTVFNSTELPSITITGNSIVGFGSRASLSAIISSTIQISSVKWQKVYSNGNAYDINVISTSGKYTGSSNSVSNPVLVINGVDFTDEANYRLVVTTALGEVISNQINLIVTGGMLKILFLIICFCYFLKVPPYIIFNNVYREGLIYS